MPFDPITSRQSILRELDAGWKLFDGIYDALTPEQWAKKFGKTWTYADQPFHLAYFDQMTAKSLREGANAPPDRMHVRSVGEMHAWNRRELASRKPGHTVQDSLRLMREAREVLRRQIEGMTDQQLQGKAWMPLLFGWSPAWSVAQAAVVHNVAEYWKLWLRTGQRTPPPSPDAIHVRLDFMMRFMPAAMNKELAARTPFTAVWNFTGPGGGAWTFRVRDGQCTVSEELASPADVMLTMKPEVFHKMVAKMSSPPVLMLTGQLKVKGLGKMGTFGKLFPEPRLDQIIEPPAAGIIAG
ncbi:MAG TPA: SCP2 sterol-binding domain-containing protein [Vicinamibacterales bacterium]|nr:SCP2 sterol-binding domain-containing protein [Vicinamibacterales bacterium]